MRWRFALAGCACLLLAAFSAPMSSKTGGTTTTAVGRSMGGMRVVLIDVLFLRADALKKDGRPEEAAALYETIIELDPKNDAAAVHLIDIYVDDLLRREATLEGRMHWWRKARSLLAKALVLNPESALLHYRAFQLVWITPVSHPDLAQPLAQEIERPRFLVLSHLRKAARLTDNIPTRWRLHLRDLSEIAPAFAAEAIGEQQAELFQAAVAAGYDLLDRRRSTLGKMLHVVEVRGHNIGIRRDRFLEAGLQTVAAVREALGASDHRRAWEVVRQYERFVGSSNALGILETLLLRSLAEAVFAGLGGTERRDVNLDMASRLATKVAAKALAYEKDAVRDEALRIGDALLERRGAQLGERAAVLKAGLEAVRALIPTETEASAQREIVDRYADGGDPEVLPLLRWIVDRRLIPAP